MTSLISLEDLALVFTLLGEIREAAAALGDKGHDIACWADDALKALGYEQ